jgi:ferritin-like metal-binding protein YciE
MISKLFTQTNKYSSIENQILQNQNPVERQVDTLQNVLEEIASTKSSNEKLKTELHDIIAEIQKVAGIRNSVDNAVIESMKSQGLNQLYQSEGNSEIWGKSLTVAVEPKLEGINIPQPPSLDSKEIADQLIAKSNQEQNPSQKAAIGEINPAAQKLNEILANSEIKVVRNESIVNGTYQVETTIEDPKIESLKQRLRNLDNGEFNTPIMKLLAMLENKSYLKPNFESAIGDNELKIQKIDKALLESNLNSTGIEKEITTEFSTIFTGLYGKDQLKTSGQFLELLKMEPNSRLKFLQKVSLDSVQANLYNNMISKFTPEQITEFSRILELTKNNSYSPEFKQNANIPSNNVVNFDRSTKPELAGK